MSTPSKIQIYSECAPCLEPYRSVFTHQLNLDRRSSDRRLDWLQMELQPRCQLVRTHQFASPQHLHERPRGGNGVGTGDSAAHECARAASKVETGVLSRAVRVFPPAFPVLTSCFSVRRFQPSRQSHISAFWWDSGSLAGPDVFVQRPRRACARRPGRSRRRGNATRPPLAAASTTPSGPS